MSEVFIAVLNMSLTASYVAATVILARLLLKKAPKIFSYALWAVVLFRMICPFSFESVLSLLPTNPGPIPQDIVYTQTPTINSGITFVDSAVNRTIQNIVPPVQPETSVNPIQVIITASSYIWFSGIVILIGYAVISYIRTKRRIFDATLVRDNIFETDRIKTPFVIGFIKPKIYIPVGLDEKETEYIISHERTHIKRSDHLIKVLAFAALSLHWFNPLMWASYFLMSKDMELSCDESVMKRSGEDIRANYSNSLLSLSVKQSGLPSPLAFGESNVKTRVKNILRYKKPAFWISIISVIAVMSVTVALACNQIKSPKALSAQEALDELKNSINYENEELSFVIPADYPTPTDWIIWINGHMSFDDGFTMSWHFAEGDEASLNRTWEAGKRYVISDTSSFDNFGMNAYILDENGNESELVIDLLDYITDKEITYLTVMELILTLPEEWRGKYTLYDGNPDRITVYHTKTYEAETGMGMLFGIGRLKGQVADSSVWKGIWEGDASVLLETKDYTYILTVPGGIPYIESTADEYLTLLAQIPEIKASVREVEWGKPSVNNIAIPSDSYDEEAGIITWYADLTHDGENEKIVVELNPPDFENTMCYKISVYGKDDKLIWSDEEISEIHAGNRGYYLYNDNGEYYILNWSPWIGGGVAYYGYEIFSFDSIGNIVSHEKDSLSYNTISYSSENNGEDFFDSPPDDFKEFITKVNSYLNQSFILIDTYNLELQYSTPENRIGRLYPANWDYDFDSDGLPDEIFYTQGLITANGTFTDNPNNIDIIEAYPKLNVNFGNGKSLTKSLINAYPDIQDRLGKYEIADILEK